MLTNIRQPQIGDVNYLFDIDLKCFDDPFPADKWKQVLTAEGISKLISTSYGNPSGYVFWTPGDTTATIMRIAVKPTYRNQGAGQQLLNAVCLNARQRSVPRVSIPVPESLCCPGDPRDASRWLLNRGFRTNGRHSILKDHATCFGKVEDAFLFVLEMEKF